MLSLGVEGTATLGTKVRKGLSEEMLFELRYKG